MKNSIKVGPIKKSAKIAMKPVTSVIKGNPKYSRASMVLR